MQQPGFLDQRAKLGDRGAVIGGGCIGAAITLALAGAGVDVALCDIDGAELETTVKAATATDARIHG